MKVTTAVKTAAAAGGIAVASVFAAVPASAAPNIQGYLSANVVELLGGEHGGPVTGARVATLSGGSFRVDATTYVLATGGIENARLLLASNAVRPAGLGNEFVRRSRGVRTGRAVRAGEHAPASSSARRGALSRPRRPET